MQAQPSYGGAVSMLLQSSLFYMYMTKPMFDCRFWEKLIINSYSSQWIRERA